MTNLLFYGYYYHFPEIRKQTKVLVDSADYTNAKVKLDSAIQEHNTKYGNTPDTRKDFQYGERNIMRHAKLHLDTVIEQDDPSFLIDKLDGSPTTVGHHSDKVKTALSRQPVDTYPE